MKKARRSATNVLISFFAAIVIYSLSGVVHSGAGSVLELIESDDDTAIELTRSSLDGLTQQFIETTSPYFEGQVSFSGPTFEDVLEHGFDQKLDANTPLILVALNDYTVTTTFDVLMESNAIIATRKEGMRLSIRERGPYWVILPFSENPELDNEQYHRLSVWQLHQIRVGK